MIIKQAVLAALATREGWNRYGALFTGEFFSSEIGRDVFQVIHDFWDRTKSPSIKSLDIKVARGLLTSRASSDSDAAARVRYFTQALEIPVGKHDALIQEALYSYSAETEIRRAAMELQEKRFDPAATALRFDAIAQALSNHANELSPAISSTKILAAEASINTYAFGLPRMDAALRGGLWEGEVGVVLAPTRRGKTHYLIFAGKSSLLDGTPVQHHTCEISRRRTAIRYYQTLLGMSRDDVMAHPRKVSRLLKKLKLPPWSIRDHSGSGVSTGTIRRDVHEFIESCSAAGIKKRPLIIVDYIDLIRNVSGSLEGRFALNATVRELREIAARFDVGLWTASQTNRPTFEKSHIRMQDVAEAIGKVEKADVVVILNQNGVEKIQGVMRFFIDKARERHGVEGTELFVRCLTETQSFSDDLGADLAAFYGEGGE